jgi:hypothetical protein
MKSRKLILIFGALACALLPLGTLMASAWISYDYQSVVEITYATYTDLDDDGVQDDIYSTFSLFPLLGYRNYFYGYIDLYMEMPSGDTWYILEDLDLEVYLEEDVTINWYNCATESGWYEFTIVVDSWVIDDWGMLHHVYEADVLIFDPPEKSDVAGAPYATIEW